AASLEPNGQLRLWDLGRSSDDLIAVNPRLRPLLLFSADGTMLFTTDIYGAIIIFDLKKKAQSTFDGHAGPIIDLVISHDSTFIVYSGSDRSVRMMSLKTGEQHIIHFHKDLPSAIELSNDGTLAASGAEDGAIHIWDTIHHRGRELRGHRDG